MTGLIYVAIVALWAAVLIPMWLRRHDDGEVHRLERHQEAMGVLARFRSGESANWTPARRAARRRRTIVTTLAALTFLGAAAWVLQMAGAWIAILPGLVLLGFIASAAWATRTAPAQRTTSAHEATDRTHDEREQRRQERRRRAAERIEQDGYPYVSTRDHRTEIIATPRTQRDRVVLEGTDIDQDAGSGIDTGREQVAPPRRRAAAALEQVFDQTA